METYNLPPNHFINIVKLTKVRDIASKEVEIKIQQLSTPHVFTTAVLWYVQIIHLRSHNDQTFYGDGLLILG